MRELLCNNSLFVGQLYDDKSLALRARDLIFFTTDLQTVNSGDGQDKPICFRPNPVHRLMYDNCMYHMMKEIKV